MKKIYSLFLLLTFYIAANAQQFNLPDLIDLTSFTQQKFQTHVEKRKFRQEHASKVDADVAYSCIQSKKQKGTPVSRYVGYQSRSKTTIASYKTTSLIEATRLKEQIKKFGYKNSAANEDSKNQGAYFQKDNISIKFTTELKDSIQSYVFLVERKELPKPKDIFFAEGLLQINSHEYLTYVFGAANVSKDVFYYSEKETNKCSVLFPKSNQEVVFIWEDEVNYSKTSFLVIGGHLQTGASVDFNRRVEQNLWQSEQGIYSGMSLKALQSLNESSINFYSWQMEEAGVLTPKNIGKINFDRIGLVLNCLNCVKDPYAKNTVVNSDTELTQDRKVYVSTMIILPEKEKPATASR